MKQYLIYLIKNKWLQTLVMTLIPTFIFVISVLINAHRYYNPDLIPALQNYRTPDVFISPIVYIMILVPIVVIFRLYIFRNTKDVDLYYSLPISRQKLLLTQIIFGFIQLMFIWTVMYFFGLITFSILTEGNYLTRYLLLLFPTTIFYIFVLYGITSYLFLKANTIVDGIAFILIFHTAFLFISSFLSLNNMSSIDFAQTFAFNPFYSIGNLASHLIFLSRPVTNSFTPVISLDSLPYLLMNTIVFLALAILGFILSYQSILHEKTENIGRLSLSKIGYKTLIPMNIMFATASTYFIFYGSNIISITIIAAAGFIGYFIMRRSVKITWVDFASVITPIIVAVMLISVLR